MELVDRIPAVQLGPLRDRFGMMIDLRWVERLASVEGWMVANRRYLRSERRRGQNEMRALLAALAIEPPVLQPLVLEVIGTAFELCGVRDGAEGATIVRSPTSLDVRLQACPTYERLIASGWRGVTACGSYHRRDGWYRAVGTFPEEVLTGEQKWGDPYCSVVITFSHEKANRVAR